MVLVGFGGGDLIIANSDFTTSSKISIPRRSALEVVQFSQPLTNETPLSAVAPAVYQIAIQLPLLAYLVPQPRAFSTSISLSNSYDLVNTSIYLSIYLSV